MWKPSKSDLAKMLSVSEDYFHTDIKPIIKRDFSVELEKILRCKNPDIWLDVDNNIVLVNPLNLDEKHETTFSIFNYK